MSLSRRILRRRLRAIGLGWLVLLFNSALMAGDLRVVELFDGSQIAGEIVLFEHGVYTIESVSLGRLHIPSSDIRAIRSERAAPSSPLAPSPEPVDRSAALELPKYESQLVGDPAVLSMVIALQNDPDVLEVLNDPTIMRAIADRDYSALQHNAKILKLEHNPTIRQILDVVIPK